MYKVKHGIAPKIMCELFNEAKVPYNLRQDVRFCSYIKTVLYSLTSKDEAPIKIENTDIK